MKIRNEKELAAAVRQAGDLLQAISDYAGRDSRVKAAVAFPRGFIRTASEQRTRLSFVADTALRSNMAYTLILSDTIYWLLIRTDIAGTAREMLVKLFLFLGGTFAESITKEYLKGVCGASYKGRTQYMLEHGVIGPELKTELDWLWDMRNNMHLFQLTDPEFEAGYTMQSQTRCVIAFRDLLHALKAKGRLRRGAG